MNAKIDEFEMALAHHEKQIADLSEMMSVQWKEIAILKGLLQAAQDRISDMESRSDSTKSLSTADAAAAQRPPHY